MAKKTDIVTNVTTTKVWNRDDMAFLIDAALMKHVPTLYPKFWDLDNDEEVADSQATAREQQVLDLKATDVSGEEALIWAVIRRKSYFLLGQLTVAHLGWLTYKLFGSNLSVLHDPYLFEVYEIFKERHVLVAETKNQARALAPRVRNVGQSAFLLNELLALAIKRYKYEQRELKAREKTRREKQEQVNSKALKEAVATLQQTASTEQLLQVLSTADIITYLERRGYNVTACADEDD